MKVLKMMPQRVYSREASLTSDSVQGLQAPLPHKGQKPYSLATDGSKSASLPRSDQQAY